MDSFISEFVNRKAIVLQERHDVTEHVRWED